MKHGMPQQSKQNQFQFSSVATTTNVSQTSIASNTSVEPAVSNSTPQSPAFHPEHYYYAQHSPVPPHASNPPTSHHVVHKNLKIIHQLPSQSNSRSGFYHCTILNSKCDLEICNSLSFFATAAYITIHWSSSWYYCAYYRHQHAEKRLGRLYSQALKYRSVSSMYTLLSIVYLVKQVWTSSSHFHSAVSYIVF